MIANRNKLLAICAHPDVAELTCYGTLAKFLHKGTSVYVLQLTAGECSNTVMKGSRQRESDAAARLVGYNCIKESLPDGKLRYDLELIKCIEKYVNKLSPDIIITHYPQILGIGHQDHVVVSSAAVNVAKRNSSVEWILYAEPPTQNGDFVPNCYVDITEYIEIKKKAVLTHQLEKTKSYMNPGIIVSRAQWWALQVDPSEYNRGCFYEAFIIIKGMLK